VLYIGEGGGGGADNIRQTPGGSSWVLDDRRCAPPHPPATATCLLLICVLSALVVPRAPEALASAKRARGCGLPLRQTLLANGLGVAVTTRTRRPQAGR
jgi:hypothetical protein